MTPNDQWFQSLPPCEAPVPCGTGRHQVRWEAGALRLLAHPDAEAELVLAALGGEKAGCVKLAEAWTAHATDLTALTYGPRGPADRVEVSWNDVTTLFNQGPMSGAGPAGPGRRAVLVSRGGIGQRPGGGSAKAHAALEEQRSRITGRYSLLALGYPFQVRLCGQVAAAHAGRLASDDRPAMTAALAGRLAPVAEDWIGIDPGQVRAVLHDGDGWGSVELTGKGTGRRLTFTLPPDWLARVWACGLGLAGSYLVVGVERPGWPDARVLGVRSPGAEPEPIDVHDTAGGAGDAPHWEV